MTLGEWLDARCAAAPDALARRVRELVAPHAGADADRACELCLEAGEALLAELLREGCASRQSALDLLAVDALVTYAFEAAGAEPGSLDGRAHRAMVGISALANVAA
jgi:hypothetical protein